MNPRHLRHTPDARPTHAQLCVLTHYAFVQLGLEAPDGDVIEAVKVACIRAGFAYPRPHALRGACDAVRVVREKGYQTPRRAS